MRPTQSSRTLEAIVRDLIDTRDGATYFVERVWGVSLSYDLGGDHPLVGRSAPDFGLLAPMFNRLLLAAPPLSAEWRAAAITLDAINAERVRHLNDGRRIAV